MAYKLHIPPCIDIPPHHNHPPSPERPLRIVIQGPLPAIEKLIPGVEFRFDYDGWDKAPQSGGRQLAELTHEALYGSSVDHSSIIIRDEYPAWVCDKTGRHTTEIDYYGVTFDHLVPPDDEDPEVLALSIIELEVDSGEFANGVQYANDVLRFQIDPEDYLGKKVLRQDAEGLWSERS